MKKLANLKIINNKKKINAGQPQPALIASAADILGRGGVIAFPTSGLYGLGADAFNPLAVDRVFAIKQRPPGKPLLVLLPDRDAVHEVAAGVPSAALHLMDRFWPGRVTIVLDALSGLPESLVAGTGKVGVRVSGHPVARALASEFGRPITGTSANISGRPGCSRIADLDNRIAAQLDLILDAGRLTGGQGSTVVDVTGGAPVILREGVVSNREILAALD